jgi:hypothetical protein
MWFDLNRAVFHGKFSTIVCTDAFLDVVVVVIACITACACIYGSARQIGGDSLCHGGLVNNQILVR